LGARLAVKAIAALAHELRLCTELVAVEMTDINVLPALLLACVDYEGCGRNK
jgi:hypothetical protein